MKRLLTLLLICLWLGSVIPAAADVTVGLPADPDTGNGFPFGGSGVAGGAGYLGEYQQVYTSSVFSGPITITNLEFFNTQTDSGGATSMNSGNWAISLSTTSADWNTLSTNFSSNIGGDNTLVFSGDLSQPWAFGNTLVIDLSTPFTYNPSNGNLLMDVLATNTNDSGGLIFFDDNGSFTANTIMGRVFIPQPPAGSPTVQSGFGLVTEFSTSVPEPSTFLLLGAGLAGVGLLRRRFKK